MRFSERYGYKPVREIIKKESIDDALKNLLWSVLNDYVWKQVKHGNNYSYTKYSNISSLLNSYWINIFKLPNDTLPISISDAIKRIRSYFFHVNGTKFIA